MIPAPCTNIASGNLGLLKELCGPNDIVASTLKDRTVGTTEPGMGNHDGHKWTCMYKAFAKEES